jgi:hypothetical protein
MADVSKLEARIRMLEARREKGESVPELDALYSQMDAMNRKGYEEATKGLTGERPAPARAPAPQPVKKASGGMTASARADGIAQRGKTRGKMC